MISLTPRQLRQLRNADGNRIRAARHLVNLTQVQLCAQLGMTQSQLSDLERQRWQSPSLATARRLADFFGCTVDDLFPASEAVAS